MRFSIWPSTTQPFADVLAVAQHAEATGWDRVYIADHFMANGETADDTQLTPMLEATAALAALATGTSTIGLASLVFSVTYRHPAVLARWAATVDEISGGRLTLGIGAGWQENEHAQYGIELGRPGVRIDRFEEAVEVITGLLGDRETTFDGGYFQLDRAIAEPKPVNDPMPILIGGKGPRMLGVVARHADEWNMWALPSVIAAKRRELDAACERNGRDPAGIATSTQALWYLTDDEKTADELIANSTVSPAIGGPLERLRATLGAWRDAGVDEVIVPDFTLRGGNARIDAMDTIIEQLAPEFR